MDIREQFGNYLLLKKLGEDPLGESFRAGRIGGQGMDRVVLLRVFNGPGIDGVTLWQEIGERRQLHDELSSPNIGAGVDLGEVRNTPYAAYDYISGKDLATLQKQAAKRNHPIPSDHALLIVERLALALTVGYETRLDGERVLHGCVVPQLTMISNEGETRLLGFALSEGLRKLITQRGAARELARYLSPEAHAGEPLAKTDDVYSLGVLLFELLSGSPYTAGAGDHAAAIEEVRRQPDGTPLPDGLKRLLNQSLTRSDERIGDVVTWHEHLSKIMFEGEFNPTTFNLAFFMHNLFREEIEQETKEIEVEKTMEIPVGAAVPAAEAGTVAAEPGGDVREETGVRTDETGVVRDRYGIEADEADQKRKQMLIAAAAVVVLAVAGALFFFLGGEDEGPQQADLETTAETEVTETSPPATESVAEGPTVDETAAAERAEQAAAEQQALEQRLSQLIEEKTQEQQEAYEQELEKLRRELEAAKERTAQARTEAEEARASSVEPEADEAAAEPDAQPTEEVAETGEPSQVTEPTALAAAPGDEPAGDASTPPTNEPDVASESASTTTKIAAAESVDTTTARRPQAEEPPSRSEAQKSSPSERQATEPSPPEPAAAEPTVQRGDLVQIGQPGVKPPSLIHMPSPRYPPIARRMRQQATVRVRVLVNEEGRVTEAELAGKDPGYGFGHEALAAARQARFEPATKDGVEVKVWWTVPIEFRM